MSEVVKRNCNSCKHGLLSRCEVLKNNDEYKAIKEESILSTKRYKFKEKFVCENYKSMYIEYPIEVSKINNNCKKSTYKDDETGHFVKIRPCDEKYKGKTFLGLYLGELPISTCVSHNPDTKELNISFNRNPAIFVFELNTIIYGCESWWSVIEKEEDLREITDLDISNVWYVKALNSINSN